MNGLEFLIPPVLPPEAGEGITGVHLPLLCYAKAPTQGFLNSKQAVYQLSYNFGLQIRYFKVDKHSIEIAL